MRRAVAVLSLAVCCRLVPGAEPIDFSRDSQPLLAKRCVACHSPDTQEAGLRLDEGAEWKGHWAFQPLVRPAVPDVADIDNSIDAFIVAGLARRGLPVPQPGDKATLLRRATYDLIGLPPSEQEMRDFLADTNSFQRDGDKPHAWRHRDYVIRSLNDDKPYDQFIIEQLAGDELPDPSNDALIATGFYGLGTWDDEPADRLQARYDWFDDLMATTGQTFLGLTINCARCHDHKIDPLTQRDYYAMLAFFHNITPLGDRQMNPAFIERVIPAAGQSANDVQHQAEDLSRRRAEARRNLKEIETRIREQGEQVLDALATKDLAALKERVTALEKEHVGIAKALVVSEHGPRAPETFVFERGNPHADSTPEHRVEPAFPAVLQPPTPVIPTPTPGGTTSGRRTALARWIAAADNPLTARVMANRFWQHHFGRGIVRSSSNVGFAGVPPTHPELLDWLAVEFIAGGWRLKPLHKAIMLSRSYQAASTVDAVALAKDPLNDFLWRFDMRRLTAEELRDSIHVASGGFNPEMFGPPVFPDIPAEVKATQSRPGLGWGTSPPEAQARRTIYAKVKRSLRAVGPKWQFKQYGECGKWVSDLFPHIARHVDDIAFIHSMTADSPIHGSAMLQMNSGKIQNGSPCLGSWVNYGLGTVNENLPGFVVMLDPTGGPISGAKNWSSGYMPATYQGTILRSKGAPILDLAPPDDMPLEAQRAMLDALREANTAHLLSRGDNTELAARIASYELAWKMQEHAPEAVDLASETEETKSLYGLDNPRTADFGRRCLLARRLVERGVRFVQLYSGGAHNDDNWDAHTDMVKNHSLHAGNTDQPMAALLTDLKRSGLLDSTLVIWGGEFGRQPTAEYVEGTGRDHNSYGFTMWMAGGGIKGGVSVGETDELGAAAITPVHDGRTGFHVKSLHATVLHCLGLDPNRLSYFFGGLDQKLVGVEYASPIHEILA